MKMEDEDGKDGWWDVWKVATIFLATSCFVLTLALAGMFKGPGIAQNAAATEEATYTYPTGVKQPNIIFLLADDIGWADIGHTGGQWSTPAIDAIIEEGVEFTKFYSHALCSPSRMAFLTGRFAWRLGSQYPEVIHGMMTAQIPIEEKTYGEVTRSQGYNNYYVGRWGVGYASWDFVPTSRGFDKFFGYFGPEEGYYNHSHEHFTFWTDVYDLWDNEEVYLEGNGTYSEDMFFDKSIEYITEAMAQDKPFTLTYASQTAHAPIDDDIFGNPPETFSECDGVIPADRPDLVPRVYFCNKVKYLDKKWGELIQFVKDSGLWENTLIMMTSDNGGQPYTVGGNGVGLTDWACNWPLRAGKVTYYEGGIRLWAGMSGGVVPADLRGTQHTGLTHIVDFATTAMRLSMSDQVFESLREMSCGSQKQQSLTMNCKTLDGRNLLSMEEHELIVHNVPTQFMPAWMDKDDAPLMNNYAATDGEWKYMVGLPDVIPQSTGWYKFPGQGMITSENNPAAWERAGYNCSHGCVFYLPDDPSETKDLSGEYPEIAAYFYDIIDAIWKGGFDDDYHPGQNYDLDIRGFNTEKILRPFLSLSAHVDYVRRVQARSGDPNFNYTNTTRTFVYPDGMLMRDSWEAEQPLLIPVT